MKSIETTAVVGDDRKLSLQLPPEVAPGEDRILVVIDEQISEAHQPWTMDDWPVHDAELVAQDFTLRREELYGDDGR